MNVKYWSVIDIIIGWSLVTRGRPPLGLNDDFFVVKDDNTSRFPQNNFPQSSRSKSSKTTPRLLLGKSWRSEKFPSPNKLICEDQWINTISNWKYLKNICFSGKYFSNSGIGWSLRLLWTPMMNVGWAGLGGEKGEIEILRRQGSNLDIMRETVRCSRVKF